MNKKLVFALLPILAYACYKVGMWSISDTSTQSTTGMTIVHFDVLSTRNGHCNLMVRNSRTKKIEEIEPYGDYHCPRFQDGDAVDMEVWKDATYFYAGPDFVFKGDYRGEERTYHSTGDGKELE